MLLNKHLQHVETALQVFWKAKEQNRSRGFCSITPSFLPSLCWIAFNAASKNSPQTSNRPQNSDKFPCITGSILLLLLFSQNSSSLSDRKKQRFQFFQNIYRQNRTLRSRIRIKFPNPISSPWTPEDAAQHTKRTQRRRFCAGDHSLVLLGFSSSGGSRGEDDNSKSPQRSRIWNFAPASRIFWG